MSKWQRFLPCILQALFEYRPGHHILWGLSCFSSVLAENDRLVLQIRPQYPVKFIIYCHTCKISRSQWPRGLRRKSSAARLLRSWVRIPLGAWMFVCCECCVLSGRGLCDGLITRPEESYRMWRVFVCDQETSKTRRLKPATGLLKYNHNGL